MECGYITGILAANKVLSKYKIKEKKLLKFEDSPIISIMNKILIIIMKTIRKLDMVVYNVF